MLFCTLCLVAHVFLLVPGCVLHFHIVTIQSLLRKIASAMLTWRTGLPVLCSLRLLRHWLWIVTKNRAYKFTPLGRILYPRYHPNSLCEKWKLLEAIFTFTIRLLTHVTSEETSYPAKSSILPVCGSRGNFDSAWTSGSFSAGELPSLSGKKNLTVHVHCLYFDMIIPE